ncbi:MAG: DUF2384 domain-containing protein [Rhodanobacter sp.]|nr:MAG: DUF2384 domain-containing protein [Rhodanobacter sp.]
MGAMKPGRNDPCPCGSGRKYKQCCLAAAETRAHSPAQMTWRRIRRELEGFPLRMLRFVGEHYGPSAIDEAWHEFNLWPDEEQAFDPGTPHMSVFMPWMFHRWNPNPDETEVADTALPPIAPTRAYIERESRKLSPLVREYLESCLAHPFSFFEVMRCQPGQGFTLCDLLTGQSHEVLEHSASRRIRVHDVLFGQLATVQGITLLEATSPVAMPPDDKLAIIELRKRVQKPVGRTGTDMEIASSLEMWDIEMRELYLDLSEQLLYPSLPHLQNTDGEDTEFHKLVFHIDSAQQAFDLLGQADAQALGMHPLHDTVEHTADGELQRAQIDWLKTDEPAVDDSHTVLGTLRIGDGKLTAEVNSRERADALTNIIGETLGTHARFRLDEVQTPEQALAAHDLAASPDDILQDDPDVQALLSDYLQRHYRTWIDTALPALQGRTPREAVRDTDGRDQVEALVQQIERHGEQQHPPMDASIVRMLRRQLGLEDTDSRVK